jgi:hypothetical protein
MSDPLLQKAREKAERVEKPVAVDVAGIGELYVRPRLMGERDAADEAEQKGDYDAVCLNVARLLCEPDGKRKPDDAIREWASVFMKLPQGDIVKIGNAADGNAGAAPGN